MEDILPPIKPVGGVAVPCLVLEKNRVQFIDYVNNVIGKVLSIPCRQIDQDSTGDAWAVPIKDYGVFTGFTFIPKAYDLAGGNDYSVNPPTYDSLTCFRIWDKITEELEWYVLGSRSDFSNACYTCCPGTNPGYVTMPGVNLDGTRNFNDLIAPTVVLGDIQNNAKVNVSYWGLPTLPVGYNYFPAGSYNNIPFPTATPSTGFANTTTLLTWLNANAASVGSPSTRTLVWSVVASSAGGLLVATGGANGDIIGMAVVPVKSS